MADLQTPREEGENRTSLIVNYLPQTMTETELYYMFVTVGPLKSCRVMRNTKIGYSYGFGFVNYQNAGDAAKAIKTLNGLQVQNKRLKVSYARPPGEDIKKTNLYVKNLPRGITETQIEKIFGKYGNILQINILKDKITGLPKGAAFVRFDRRQEAQEAIKGLNGHVLENGGEPLNVKTAEDHGKQKAAYYAGWQAGFNRSQERGTTMVGVSRSQGSVAANKGQERAQSFPGYYRNQEQPVVRTNYFRSVSAGQPNTRYGRSVVFMGRGYTQAQL